MSPKTLSLYVPYITYKLNTDAEQDYRGEKQNKYAPIFSDSSIPKEDQVEHISTDFDAGKTTVSNGIMSINYGTLEAPANVILKCESSIVSGSLTVIIYQDLKSCYVHSLEKGEFALISTERSVLKNVPAHINLLYLLKFTYTQCDKFIELGRIFYKNFPEYSPNKSDEWLDKAIIFSRTSESYKSNFPENSSLKTIMYKLDVDNAYHTILTMMKNNSAPVELDRELIKPYFKNGKWMFNYNEHSRRLYVCKANKFSKYIDSEDINPLDKKYQLFTYMQITDDVYLTVLNTRRYSQNKGDRKILRQLLIEHMNTIDPRFISTVKMLVTNTMLTAHKKYCSKTEGWYSSKIDSIVLTHGKNVIEDIKIKILKVKLGTHVEKMLATMTHNRTYYKFEIKGDDHEFDIVYEFKEW